ncbi:MAG: hypothetical protein L6R45_35665 [Anaerolineae bacterium]|nr:hypothetical protein [Anaerolineae bacterium]
MTYKAPFSADLTTLARRLGLSPDTIYYCLEAELVEQALTEPDLAELRRVRRLLDLEVNLAGVEIILRMRRQMLAMQSQLEALTSEMRATQSRFEQQIRELERRLAHDLW